MNANRNARKIALTPAALYLVAMPAAYDPARVVAEAAAEAARPVPQLDGRHDWCGFC